MFDSKDKKDSLFIQIQKGEKIMLEEKEQKKAKKDNEKLNFAVEAIIEAGKVVVQRNAEEEKKKAAEKKATMAAKQSERLVINRRPHSNANIDARRRIGWGLLLEKHFPEIKEMTIPEVDELIKDYIAKNAR